MVIQELLLYSRLISTPLLGQLAQLVQSICLTSRGSGVQIPHCPHRASVAELADALDSKSSGLNPVRVRLPPLARRITPPWLLAARALLFLFNAELRLLQKKTTVIKGAMTAVKGIGRAGCMSGGFRTRLTLFVWAKTSAPSKEFPNFTKKQRSRSANRHFSRCTAN
jgi:hypothetical protein